MTEANVVSVGAIRHVAWLMVAVICLAHSASAQKVEVPGLDDVEAFFGRFMPAAMERYHIPGAAVSYAVGDKLVFARGYGRADRQTGQPVTVDTPFRLASLSKPVTAAAILRLVERGDLSLDTDVTRILGRFKLTGDQPGPVTVAHLLTHTAGLDEQRARDRFVDPAEAVPLGDYLARRMPSRIRPAGEIVSYSNFGYALLGYLVEQVSGRPFPEFVRQEVFQPAGMRRSTFDQSHRPADLAKGYDYREGVYHLLPFRHHNTVADGALISTAADMGRFAAILLSGGKPDDSHVLNESSVRLMLRRHFTHHPALPGMGLGLYEDFRNGRRILLHEGSTDEGFESLLFLDLDANVAVCAVYNQRNSNLRLDLLREFLDRFFPGDIPPLQRGPAADLAAYIGTFGHVRHPRAISQRWFVPREKVDVTVDDGVLLVSFDGASPGRWVPVGDELFENERSRRLLAFRRDARSRPAYLFLGIDAYERTR